MNLSESMKSSKFTRILNFTIIVLVCLTILLPFMHVLAISFNSGIDAQKGGIAFGQENGHLKMISKYLNKITS